MSYQVPFSIRFTGPLTGQRLALLVSELGLHTTVEPKQRVSLPMATAQLDPSTGLYLIRGQGEDEWVLECRAYGNPAPAWLRQWRLRAVWVVGQLDSELEVRLGRDSASGLK
jgi:hypothetical protein